MWKKYTKIFRLRRALRQFLKYIYTVFYTSSAPQVEKYSQISDFSEILEIPGHRSEMKLGLGYPKFGFPPKDSGFENFRTILDDPQNVSKNRPTAVKFILPTRWFAGCACLCVNQLVDSYFSGKRWIWYRFDWDPTYDLDWIWYRSFRKWEPNSVNQRVGLLLERSCWRRSSFAKCNGRPNIMWVRRNVEKKILFFFVKKNQDIDIVRKSYFKWNSSDYWNRS